MSWVAIGVGAVSLGTGIYKSARASSKAKKAQRELEGLKTPTTKSSATIEDYYRRASASPYASLQYRMNERNIMRGTVQGINATQDRRGALGSIAGLIGQQNSAQFRNAAGAEQTQNRMLGDAVRLKAGDDQRMFNINQMLPYEKLISLYSSQAAGANQQVNAAQQDISSGLNIGAMGAMSLGDYYSDENVATRKARRGNKGNNGFMIG